MSDPVIIHTHEGGTFIFRKKANSAIPLWEITVLGTVALNEQSLRAFAAAIDIELPVTE